METGITAGIMWLLGVLALPRVGLTSVFLISFISATLLPMGSEPAVFAVVEANPALFWSVIAVATLGNTLGGVVDYAMGFYAKKLVASDLNGRWYGRLQRMGPKSMLLAWMPVIGDPLCTLAGWLRLPFWPSVAYMAIGKCSRYLLMTAVLSSVPNGWWHRIAGWLS